MQIHPREIRIYTTPNGRASYRHGTARIKMSIDTKLQQCTIPFKDFLLKDLAEPEFAKGYLETALQDFYVDGNLEIMMLVIKNIAQAQGGTENLTKWTSLSTHALTYLLQPEDSLQWNKVLDILSELSQEDRIS